MRNFIFQNETSVYFGRGCVREYLGSLCALYQRVMFVCARGELSRSGIGEEVSAILRGEGKLAAVFSGVSSALTYRQVHAGADAARTSEADMILALGIDAVIDCGKGISLAARCAHDVWEDYWAHPGVISVDPLPLGVIAAGAEIVSACSGRAVITNEEKHVRCARDYPRLNPRFALMDPSYPCSVPQVLSSGFGVFAHIMEIYLHYVFNRCWSRALFSGKHTAYRILQSVCAALVLIAMLGLMISAVPISREVFALLPISGGLALGRSVHMLSAYWGFLFMGLHLGVHWQTVTKLIFRRFSHPSRRRKILLWTLGTLFALWGVYALFSRALPDYLFLKTPFVFFDDEEPLIFFFRDYLAIMAAMLWIGSLLAMGARRIDRAGR